MDTKITSKVASRVVIAAIIGIVVGLVLVIVSIGLDWRGFSGGMATGAGIGLMVVGAYFWGYANGLRRPVSRGDWRPSQDAAR